MFDRAPPNLALSPTRSRRVVSRLAPVALAVLLAAPPLGGQTVPSNTRGVTLLPGDVLQIEIWREEDLSGEFYVNERGVAVLPLIGDQLVTDLPIDQVRDRLIERYRVHLRNPSISVTPLRRIHVLGEVSKPGLYMVDPTISLAGVVALAGGTTSTGTLERIQLIRQGTEVIERVNAAAILDSVHIRSGDQIFIGQRGWFERNSTFVVSIVLSITTMAVTILAQ